MPSGNEKGKSLGERVEMVRVGQEFRNFKELAGEVGESYVSTSTCSKRAIESKLSSYLEWEKIGGNKLRIVEKFETPRVSLTFHEYILPILGELLFEQKGVINAEGEEVLTITKTNKQFFLMIGSCNQQLYNKNYVRGLWKNDLIDIGSKQHSSSIMKHVLLSNFKKNNQIIEDIRKKLKQANVVLWRNTYIYKAEGSNKFTVADTNMAANIMTSSRHALTQLNLKTMFDVYHRNLYEEYTRIAFSHSAEHYNVAFFKEANELTSTRNAIKDYLTTEKTHIKAKHAKAGLSNKVYDSLCKADKKKIYDIIPEQKLEDGDVSTLEFRIAYGFAVPDDLLEDCAKLHKLFRFINDIEV